MQKFIITKKSIERNGFKCELNGTKSSLLLRGTPASLTEAG